MVEVMVTSLMDEFYHSLIKVFKWKELFVLAVCGVALLLGIPCVMQVNAVIHRITKWRPRSSNVCLLPGGDLRLPADGPLHRHRVHHVSGIL